MAILRSAVAMSLLAAIVAAACQSQGQVFQATLLTDPVKPLPVSLTDESKLVTGITEAAADSTTTGSDPALRADQDDPNGLVLTWLGGACDQDAAVWFGPQNGGYVLSLAIHVKVGLGCPASGVPRAIRIATSRPIAVGSVTVAGG
ncbi:MAG: hypothetical protein H0V73_10650 [Chloroflexi bacterium]|nr:hypothetical protein [Chloroflexota bacterium]